jgi:hypothetical protein
LFTINRHFIYIIKIFYKLYARAHISVQPSKIIDVLKILEKTKGILFATESLGDFGIFAIAEMKSMEDMNRLKEDIKSLHMVNKVSTSI